MGRIGIQLTGDYEEKKQLVEMICKEAYTHGFSWQNNNEIPTAILYSSTFFCLESIITLRKRLFLSHKSEQKIKEDQEITIVDLKNAMIWIKENHRSPTK